MSNTNIERAVSAYNNGHYAAAFEMFKLLAEHGNAEAQYHLGIMYRSGHGVPKNNATALQWYKKAAVLGHAQGKISY